MLKRAVVMAAVPPLRRLDRWSFLCSGVNVAVPDGTPGASDSSDVIAAAIEEPTSDSTVDVAATTDAPIEAEALEGDGSDDDDGDESADEAARAADEADLQQYPESVREKFRAFEPAERKALYEFAEANARDGLKAVQEREAAIAAKEKADLEQLEVIRQKHGKFIGLEPQTLTLPNGYTVNLPPLETLEELSKDRAGRAKLLEDHNLDEDATEFWRWFFAERRVMQAETRKTFDDAAWLALDQNLQEGMIAEGLDPKQILNNAKNPHDVIKGVAGHFKAVIQKLNDDHEAHRGVLNGNAEGLRARALAGSTRQPATGGRSGSNGTAVLTPERYAAMSYEDRMKLRSTPEGRARIDRMTGGGR